MTLVMMAMTIVTGVVDGHSPHASTMLLSFLTLERCWIAVFF